MIMCEDDEHLVLPRFSPPGELRGESLGRAIRRAAGQSLRVAACRTDASSVVLRGGLGKASVVSCRMSPGRTTNVRRDVLRRLAEPIGSAPLIAEAALEL